MIPYIDGLMDFADKRTMFFNRLTKVYKHRSKQAKQAGVGCYRLYDRDLPEFPWVIELYENCVFAAEYQTHHALDQAAYAEWVQSSKQVMSQVLSISEADIYLRLRAKKDHRSEQYEKLETTKKNKIVTESGLKFILNLTDYLDTGLFLDHRLTRERIRQMCKGKKVLNLFAYTGAFTVYAAAGGADKILSIDLSNTYINWAIRNLQINKLENKANYRFLKADVLQALPDLPRDYYDLIILDPPTFSNSKMMSADFDIQHDHVRLINETVKTLTTGGQLFFSTNARKFILQESFLKDVLVEDITKSTIPFDFKDKLHRPCFRMTKM